MTWETMEELGKFYGYCMGYGLLLGAVVVLFNSWRA